MKSFNRYMIIMLALMMSVMMLLAGCGGGSSDTEAQEEETKVEETQSGESGSASAGDYDVMQGFEKKANDDGSIEYLYFNDFMLVMPGNEKWAFEPSEDGRSVTFYLNSAKQEGYGGKLVTMTAYDIDDNSYEAIPHYSVAGVGGKTNKRFIADYPTDVQWNHEDAQQEADYRDLADYLGKIGEGAVNSPLATADSNAEPVE